MAELTTQYPLPEGVIDARVNRGQLADAFNVSANTIDKWRRDGMPVLQDGTNGQSYVFQLSACWAWRAGEVEGKKQRDAEAERSVRQLRMAFLNRGEGRDADAGMSPLEARAHAEAELRLNQVGRERGELVYVSDVTDGIEAIFANIREVLQSLPDWMEREAAMDAASIDALTRRCDGALEGLAETIAERFGADPGDRDDAGHPQDRAARL
ncbi:Phage DNA packaging protein, Nu1 subunit of terminase [Monaibacterium marinum]|uniref:Phage DNA packaging protein, Nu1 subunit of terminase n=2 Tax=Pontivivens marinum TaxID=1690039 RepID=A0A2C9CPU9_9RHOB|nr:Phage DNA packaging protein, Nu1 subunit of terminase [Monaibacterium marinum]